MLYIVYICFYKDLCLFILNLYIFIKLSNKSIFYYKDLLVKIKDFSFFLNIYIL